MEKKLNDICTIKIHASYKEEELIQYLNECFDILDKLGDNHRDNFSKLDTILNTHIDIIKSSFKTYESNLFQIFYIIENNSANKELITEKRKKESDYLSKKKEEQLLQEDNLATNKKKPEVKTKKGEQVTALVPPREIEIFESKTNNIYLVDMSIEELTNYYLKEICDESDGSDKGDSNEFSSYIKLH